MNPLIDYEARLELQNLVHKWINGFFNNEQKTLEVGKEFEKFKELPEKYKTSPSNTLYRCILVARSLLKKEKPLVLDDREYSSWTYDLEAAKGIGDRLYIYRDYALIILKRTFSNDEIFLNMERLAQAVLHRGGYVDEKEIVVKNVKKNFTFQPNEIVAIKEKDDAKWEKFHQSQAESTETTSYFNYYYWNPDYSGDYTAPTGLGASFKGKTLLKLLRHKDPILASKIESAVFEDEDGVDKKEIARILDAWVNANSYTKAVKWGAELERLMPYLSKNAKKVPENAKLYRGIHIKKEAFRKLMQGETLTLENRRYSSWTTNLNVAQDFASYRTPQDEISVVLIQNFPKEALLLDVEHVNYYFNLGLALGEDEIIVKNDTQDFKFNLNNISIMYEEKSNKWIEVLRK